MFRDPYGGMQDELILQLMIAAIMQQQQQGGPRPQQQRPGGGLMDVARTARDGKSLWDDVGTLFGSSGGAAAGAKAAGAASGTGAGAVAVPQILGVKAVGGAAGAGAGAGAAGAAGAGAAKGAAAAGAAQGAAAGSGLAGAASIALPIGLGALALQTMYDTGGKDIIRGKGKSDDWINQAFNITGGVGYNLALKALGMPSLGRMVTSGKDKDQQMRDMIRKDFRNSDFTDKNHALTLADGSKFDIGKDGGSKAYNVDFEREGAGEAVGLVNPLAKLMTRGNKKLQNDFAGYFANAAMSSGDKKANARALYEKAGFDQRKAYDELNQLGLEEEELRAYHNAINQAFGNGGFAADGSIIGGSGGGQQVTSKPSMKRSNTLSPGIGLDGKPISNKIPRKRK